MKKWIAGTALALFMTAGLTASAGTVYWEGFEDLGWESTPNPPANGSGWNDSTGGVIDQVATGSNGVTSYEGSHHAEITGLTVGSDVFGNPSLGYDSVFTRLGGYSSDFNGGFTVSQAIFLDPGEWTDGEGFDWTNAVSNQGGGHLRDFIWHVGVVNGSLLVNASNNTDLNFNSYKLLNENSGNYATIASAGWYVFETNFYDNGGNLAVDFNLRDDIGGLVAQHYPHHVG